MLKSLFRAVSKKLYFVCKFSWKGISTLKHPLQFAVWRVYQKYCKFSSAWSRRGTIINICLQNDDDGLTMMTMVMIITRVIIMMMMMMRLKASPRPIGGNTAITNTGLHNAEQGAQVQESGYNSKSNSHQSFVLCFILSCGDEQNIFLLERASSMPDSSKPRSIKSITWR